MEKDPGMESSAGPKKVERKAVIGGYGDSGLADGAKVGQRKVFFAR